MKRTSIGLALTMLGATHAYAFEALANVVSVSPVYQTVNRPSQSCWTEYQQTTQAAPAPQHSIVGAIIGGVAGGLIGSRFGEGSGKVASAAAGAGVGAIAGDRVGAQSSGGTVTTTAPVQRCQQVDHYEQVASGYDVVYEYNGQRFSTRLPYNPGNQLRVNVSVVPR
jgi:uncharacterized protein YcfJ